MAPEWQWNSQETPGEDLEDTLTQDLVSTSTPVGSIVASTCNSSPSMIQIPNIAPSRLNLSNDLNQTPSHLPLNNKNLVEKNKYLDLPVIFLP